MLRFCILTNCICMLTITDGYRFSILQTLHTQIGQLGQVLYHEGLSASASSPEDGE